MASPTVQETNTSTNESQSSPHTVNLPTGITSGDLLLVFFCLDGNGQSVTWPEGWTELFEVQGTGFMFAAAYRVADGSEGITISVTTGTGLRSAHAAYRISGHDSGTAPAQATASGTSATPDPPSLDPAGWGTEDTLWLAAFGFNDDGPALDSLPTNYATEVSARTASQGTLGALCGSARRALNAASEDPGTFGMAASSAWVAATVAVRPTGAVAGHPAMRRFGGVEYAARIGEGVF